MGRDHSEEWPDERTRQEIESRLESFELSVRKHESAQYIPGDAGRRKEDIAHEWLLKQRDALVEWVYDQIKANE